MIWARRIPGDMMFDHVDPTLTNNFHINPSLVAKKCGWEKGDFKMTVPHKQT